MDDSQKPDLEEASLSSMEDGSSSWKGSERGSSSEDSYPVAKPDTSESSEVAGDGVKGGLTPEQYHTTMAEHFLQLRVT